MLGDVVNMLRIMRKRYIPDETVDISGDELLFRSEELLITKWKTIKPKTDFTCGISYTFLKDGYKVSRFYNPEGKFLYWYCDIIDVEYRKEDDTFIIIDLLLDVKLFSDGAVKVLDADELAEALEMRLVTCGQACRSLRKLDNILKMIYGGSFPPAVCNDSKYWNI
jgi:predicted RNA-binding protein associated with RNAse of E/G family